MEEWQINRAGVINFWYYDDEEFLFEDGRLLLRGANGSGKSVTMQSLVPVLFDGNKSPERLDPFGSRARRMESYLLSEGLNQEERTGYLFLEFSKPLAGRYLTIGMGMRARKNMPLQSWYFIVLDNRRVGHKMDISLYKDFGDKIPLTAKELENKIGKGGEFFTFQKDYKNAVNEHLFGYEDITDFEELIELLIQIRSPKLSKEFKPTTMYEIMQNSLITLTDEDLRPMSEAIENMDEIKTKIEALENARRALLRIDAAYIKYNTYTLAKKAGLYLSHFEEKKSISKEIKEILVLEEKENRRSKELEDLSTSLNEEEQALKTRQQSLAQHDLSILSEEKNKLEQEVIGSTYQLENKNNHHETLKRRERFLDKGKKDRTEELSLIKDKSLGLIEEMKSIAEACSFDEQSFFETEYKNVTDIPYNFSFLDHQIGDYKSKLKIGRTALIEMEGLSSEYERTLERVTVATRSRETEQKKVRDHEGLFNEIKEELIEKIFAWREGNKIALVEKGVLSQCAERVYDYGEVYQFDQVMAPVRGAYDNIRGELNIKISNVSALIQQKTKDKNRKSEELEALRAQREPEPPREEKILKNRLRLKERGIPHIPLYKAVDFVKETDDSLKGRLEEALVDLGILDALVVDPRNKAEVLKMDPGMADKYIFAQPELLSYNLSQYLSPDDMEKTITPLIIDDVLKSIFLNESPNKFYVSESGAYGMGIITGQTSGTYNSKFIGIQARKRYKQQLMDGMLEEIKRVKEEINILENQLDELRDELALGDKEFSNFPSTSDLALSYHEFQAVTSALKGYEEAEKQAQAVSEKIYEELKQKRIEAQEKTRKILLPQNSEAYEEALEELDSYIGLLNDLKLKDKEFWHKRELLTDTLLQYDNCLTDLDMALADVLRLGKELERSKRRIVDIKEQLAIADYQDILNQLDFCHKRIAEIPKLYKETIEENAKVKAHLVNLTGTFEAKQLQSKKIETYVDIYEKGFLQEYKLHYVVKEDSAEDVHGKAKQVQRSYGNVLEEKKQWVELRDELQERLIKESGELAEYNLKRIDLFKEELVTGNLSLDTSELELTLQRIDIVARMHGREVKFYELVQLLEEQIAENGNLLDEQDRELFEDILIKSVSRKISSKIYHSEKWVEKINALMESMNTSSALKFSLNWVTKKAEAEDQLSTRELVDILRGEQNLLTLEQRESLIKHFRSKIQESKLRSDDDKEQRSFLMVMKDILDYRKWFEFQLHFIKKGETKKELTNNRFFTFSGGEKAMAMYVPLFAAVYAKYQGGRSDCPKVISLDEAFAGVDEKNIRDMFRLLVELKLGFVANSQVLYGDYETVPALGIYELIRPENVTFVTLIRYKWNGLVRTLISEQEAD